MTTQRGRALSKRGDGRKPDRRHNWPRHTRRDPAPVRRRLPRFHTARLTKKWNTARRTWALDWTTLWT